MPNLTYSPNANYNGADSFIFGVSDGRLTSAPATVSISITPVNDPPALNSVGNRSIDEGQLLRFTVSATDIDDNSLTYSASNLPAGANFDATAKAFTWTPNYGQAGTYPGVRFIVSDGKISVFEDITITVKEVVLQATVDINPNTLNLDSQSDKNAITVHIELPAGYDAGQIDLATVGINILGAWISSQSGPAPLGDYDKDKVPDLMVKFNRQAVIEALAGKTGDMEMIVAGKLNNRCRFSGANTIEVIKPGK
jgi:hypothetical protein